MKCSECKYWNPNGPQNECRINPPTAFLIHVRQIQGDVPASISCWPPTKPDQWCGKFEIKPAELHYEPIMSQ